MTRRPNSGDGTVLEWKNSASATAKASLTANRHTCGRHAVDASNARLLLDDSFATSQTLDSLNDSSVGSSPRRITLDQTEPVSCWSECKIDVCVAPVLVCKTVVQTVGGGDNVSAGGLVLQL